MSSDISLLPTARRRLAPLVLMAGLLLVLLPGRPWAMSPDLLTLRDRRRADLLTGPINASSALQSWLTNQDAAGGWPAQINYVTFINCAPRKEPLAHLKRLLVLSTAYYRPGHVYYQSPAVLSSIARGLNYYVTANPYSTSPFTAEWFPRQLGEGLTLGPLLLLMQAALRPATGPAPLTATQFQAALDRLPTTTTGRCYNQNTCTGANLVWAATDVLDRACVEGNDAWALQATQAMQRACALATDNGDGIQPDHSFHQHGALLYSGGYGYHFLVEVSYWLYLARGTAFAFGAAPVARLTNLLLDGHRWMLRGTTYDHSVVGREISRQPPDTVGSTDLLELVPGQLLASGAPRAAELTAMQAELAGTQPPSLRGNRHYWRSDYMSQARPGYLATTRLHSTRLIGMESINGENLRGYLTSYGANLLYRRGDEYRDVLPVWDWARVPGVTAEHVRTFPDDDGRLGLTDFVGGVSDGDAGAAAFDLQLRHTALSGRKAWFYFDEAYVCLGANLTASGAPNPIYTSVNQCQLVGAVTWQTGAGAPAALAAQQQQALTAPGWVHHDGVGYVFPAASAPITLQNQAQTGSWSLIGTGATTPLTKEVFSLWLDHGRNPTGANYEYVVVPNVTASQLGTYAAALPLRVLANTSAVQAVRHDGAGLSEAAFYQAGTVAVQPGRPLSVDQPCLVLLREEPATTTLAVSNPRNAALTVHVTVSGRLLGPDAAYSAASNATQVTFVLPTGLAAGQSVVKQFAASPLATAVAREPRPAVYPNPTTGRLALTGVPAGSGVQVRTLLGQCVLTARLDATGGLDLRLLPAGTYLLTPTAPAPAQRTYRIVKTD